MLIYRCCRLRAAVAIRVVEIEGGDAMFAESACECRAAIHRFGCVISHIFIVVFLSVRALGNRCATFLQETLSLAGSAAVRCQVLVRGLGSIGCDQSAVTMRLFAEQASRKLTLLPRSSTTGRTPDREYLF